MLEGYTTKSPSRKISQIKYNQNKFYSNKKQFIREINKIYNKIYRNLLLKTYYKGY